MLENVLCIVVLISFFLLLIVLCNNRFFLAIMKIDKAEEDINMYLTKKKELLDRTRSIVSKELKLDNFLSELDDSFEGLNNFQVSDALKVSYNSLLRTIDDNEKLLKSDALNAILDDLEENEENIGGAIKFYNDTVVNFNHLLVSFPSAIVGFFRGYRKKDFYSDEKKEMFEILKDK